MSRSSVAALVLLATLSARGEGLESVREPLGRLVAFQEKDGRLAIDRASWLQIRSSREEREAFRRELASRHQVLPEAIPDALLDEDVEAALIADPRELFKKVMSLGEEWQSSEGEEHSASDAEATVHIETEFATGYLCFDLRSIDFELNVVEKGDDGLELRLEEHPASGLRLTLTWPSESLLVTLLSTASGRVSVVGRAGDRVICRSGESMAALLKGYPEEISLLLARPLDRLGISLAPRRFLPEVMAAATSGFGAASPEATRAVEDAVRRLADEDTSVREAASQELEAILPLVLGEVRESLAGTVDAEVRVRLEELLATRPDLDRAVAYVREVRLHEDREYLIEVMRDVPAFRSAARARLTELCGRDYGADPATWPTGR